VQAIIVSIDQHGEAALGNREFFLNRPHGLVEAFQMMISRRAAAFLTLLALFSPPSPMT